MISTKTKTKNAILLALVSTIFILSMVSFAIPQQQSQQAFGQGLFQAERDQSPPQLTIDEANNETEQTEPTSLSTTTENNRKIILNDITIPINSNTTLSLEMPDSKITVQPNK
jgi:hypothetical protein